MNTIDFLKEKNVEFERISHHETHDAQRLAATLHIPGREVAKTVLLQATGDYNYVAVLPANQSVDFQRLADMLGGCQLKLAAEDEINQHCPDCEFGALPPFGSQYGMKTIVEESLAEDETIVFEANTHHEAIRMSFEDFRRIEQPLIGSFGTRSHARSNA